MDPSAWRTKPTLTGTLVDLRPFRESDFPQLGRMLADPEALRLTGAFHSRDACEGRADVLDDVGLDWYRTRNRAPDRLDLAIVDRSGGECVGEAVLNDVSFENESCNFRILIGPSGRDRGLGSEATRLIVAYGFDVLGLHRIELSVYAFNPRAIRTYEKAGFTAEGVRRDAFKFEDEWIDVIDMARLATDPT